MGEINCAEYHVASDGRDRGWTDSEIKRAITKGIARDGRVLNPPMAIAWYSGMTESDLDAIVAWLRTVPPLD